jgi:diadenosine tetraphosphate (Ap4A) HIT family hydrolase
LDTLIVNPFHHCARIWELTGEESQGLGPLLRLTSLSIRTLLAPDQIYPCQWSHAGWEPGHLHFVLQPAWDSDRNHYERPGPFMQDAMFEANEMPAAGDVEAFAEGARQTFRRLAASVADVA